MIWKKVDKRKAERVFNGFGTVYLLPSKMRTDNMWMSPMPISLDWELTFVGAVNAFRYYNCNSELGKGVAFYLKEEER